MDYDKCFGASVVASGYLYISQSFLFVHCKSHQKFPLTLSNWSRSRQYTLINLFTETQTVGDNGEKKLHHKRQKPAAEPHSTMGKLLDPSLYLDSLQKLIGSILGRDPSSNQVYRTVCVECNECKPTRKSSTSFWTTVLKLCITATGIFATSGYIWMRGWSWKLVWPCINVKSHDSINQNQEFHFHCLITQ